MSKLKVIFFLIVYSVLTFASSTLYIESPYSKVGKGDTFFITVSVEGVYDVNSLEYKLTFDSNKLEMLDSDNLRDGIQGENILDKTYDEFTVSGSVVDVKINFSSETDLKDKTSLTRMYFKAKDTADSGTLNFNVTEFYKNSSLYTIDINSLNIELTDNENAFSVDTSGGELFGINGVLFEIPENTFLDKNEITVKKTTLNDENLSQFEPKTDEFSAKTDIYYRIDLKDNKVLNRFLTVYFPFTDSDIPSGFKYYNMKVFYFNETYQVWERIGGEVVKNPDGTYYVKIKLNHFSLFTLIADKYKAPTNNIGDVIVYPNPFSPNGNGINDTVSFKFSLKNDSKVTFKIFDRTGYEIKVLADDDKFYSGENVLEWDGKDMAGNTVITGIYVFKITARDYSGHADKKTGTVIVSNSMRE